MSRSAVDHLLFLLGHAALAAGCTGDVISSTPEDEEDTGEGPTSDGPTSTSGSASASASGSASASATMDPSITGPTTLADTSTITTDGFTSTETIGESTTTRGPDTTTTTEPPDTTTTTEPPPDSSSSTFGPFTTYSYDTTFGNFTTTFGDFTTYGEISTFGGFTTTFGDFTTGGFYYAYCDTWAAQRTYCIGDALTEQLAQYYCNNVMMPAYYAYSAQCGYDVSDLLACLSTLDCAEWPTGDGDECTDEFDAAQDSCG